jgi:pSer/pThr/pTyr-binding forkhead associated (FHA) protein
MLKMGWGDNQSKVNDISIMENHTNYISSCHATLELEGRQWVIRDGQWTKDGLWKRSLNGTMVNDKIIDSSEGVRLNHNDIVTIGDVTLKVVHT